MTRFMSRAAALCCCIIALAATPRPAAAQDDTLVELLTMYDRDVDGRLDRAELTAFFLAHDKAIADLRAKHVDEPALRDEADLRADDALSYRCGSCMTVAIEQAAAFVRDSIRLTTPRRFRLGWKGLSFRRFATDPADPRQLGPDRRPALFSYKRDAHAKVPNQVNWLGGIQLFRLVRNIDQGSVPHHFVVLTPAVEADIDGSKPANETSLDFGVPVTYEWERGGGRKVVSGFSLTVTPKRLTDRDFEREGWELATELSTSSVPLLRMGYTTAVADDVTGGRGALLLVYWKPSLRIETGEITDAAGNTKLEVLQAEGRYSRVAPRLAATVRSERLLPGFTIGLDYFHRVRATRDADYGYGELRFIYDLNADRSLSVGMILTRGRKPPDFANTDRILIGFGFLQ